MNEEKISILYVDDEVNNLTAFKATFRREYKIFTATDAEEGLRILRENEVHIIITDQRMPEITGIEFLVRVIPEFPDPIRILMTGYADIEAVIDAINKGQVYRYVSKPWIEHELKITIDNAYEIYSLREANKKLTKDLIKMNEQLEFLLRQQMLS